MTKYKNDPELVKMVTKELERLVADFKDNSDDLSQYWDNRHERFEFLIYTREILQKVRQLE
jgi:hypothetical protein